MSTLQLAETVLGATDTQRKTRHGFCLMELPITKGRPQCPFYAITGSPIYRKAVAADGWICFTTRNPASPPLTQTILSA